MTDKKDNYRRNILIIHSEGAMDPDLTVLLGALGYVHYRRAAPIDKDLDIITKISPDMVLLEISLKGDTDQEDITKIIKEKFGIPAVLITSHAESVILKQQLEFETLLSDLSSDFVNLSPESVDTALSSWMERLCLFLKVDRVAMHQFSRDKKKLAMTHSYAVPGIEKAPMNITSDHFPWFTKKALDGETIRLDDSARDLPGEAEAERRFLREQGAKSTISIPLKIGHRVLGAVVFGSLRARRTWSDDLVQRMKLLGEVFANALMRKRFEEALRESRERFRKAFEHAALGIIIFDTSGRFLEANSFFCNLLGYTETDLINLGLEEITHPDDREITRKRIKQALAGEIQYIWMEKRYLSRKGEEIWAYVSSSLVRKPDGSPLYFISHIQDISEIKRSRELLEETNTALKVVMDHRLQDRMDSEKNLLATMEKFAFPYIERLNATPLDHEQRAYVELLHGNLKEFASPFANRLSSLKDRLTPTELQVTDLIRRGNTSKEISSLLHMSVAAVYFHRNNIRKKLGLINEKTNLRSFLLDLS